MVGYFNRYIGPIYWPNKYLPEYGLKREIAQALGQVIDLFGASLALEGVNSAVVEISEIGSVEIGGL